MQNKVWLLTLLILLLSSNDIFCQNQNYQDSMMFYYNKSDFNKAISFEEQLVEKNRKLIPANDSAMGVSLNDLGFLYNKMGLNEQAELSFNESIAIEKKFFGENHPEYAACLDNIARLYRNTGRYSESEAYSLKAILIYKAKPGEETNEYATSINNLGNLYILTGNYSSAEALFLKTIAIRQKISGEKSIEYATAFYNLALVYKLLNNYDAAIPIIKKTIVIFKEKYGLSNLKYASVISTLAGIYYLTGNFNEADSLAAQSLQIRRNILGENHPDYATALNEIASLYRSEGQYGKAEALFLQSLEIRRKTQGENHPDYAVSLNNLGGLYFTMGDYNRADSVYHKSLTLTKRIYGEENIHYLDYLNNIGNSYSSTGNYAIANNFFSDAFKIERKLLLDKLDFLSETELLAYSKIRDLSIKWMFSLLWHYRHPELLKTAYNSRLLLKGISVQNTSSLSKQMAESKDNVLLALRKNYKGNKFLVNKMLSLAINKRNINTDSLNNITNQQEKELLRRSAPYRDMKNKLNTTWQDVHNNLKPNEAAIEFVKFNYLKRTVKEEDTIYYVAMLLRPQDTVPVFIKLFEERQFKSALKNFVYTAQVLYRGSNSVINKKSVSKKVKTNIYDVVWQPLEPYLKKTKTIYFAPDGLLHQLAFAAIPYHKDSLLSDKYNLVQLTSTRQVAIKDSNQTVSSIALFGGINYNKQQTDTTAPTNADPYAYVYQQNRSAGLDSFNYLPNTKHEVLNIEKRMEQKKRKVYLFSGEKATEEAFRKLGSSLSPDIIHFATHGFTLPDAAKQKAENNTFKISDNPLLRAGLVLAGGNKGWKGKSTLDEDDGILTALEISSVPLQNTQLAVLSACETGVGELRGSEGVFGLQRAFKLAGVNYVMASLWQVPDKETGEFMNNFYTNLLADKSIRQAFIVTQQTMRKKYAPYYWAAFTLVQ